MRKRTNVLFISRGSPIPLAALLLTVFSRASTGSIASTDLGTDNSTNWVATVGGGGSGTPFLSDGNTISVTSNLVASGQWITGASSGTFNGFWYADEIFDIPAGASNVSLSFSNLYADDRAVLELNGVILGDCFWAGTGLGVMSFPPGPPDVPYTFAGVTDGVVTSGFSTGINDLRLVVNNAPETPPYPFLDTPTQSIVGGDKTYAGLDATLAYAAPVPEPSTLALLSICITVLVACPKRRRTELIGQA